MNDEFDPLNPRAWFHQRVALVTGASSGMGKAIAAALGQAGAVVGINYHSNRDAAIQLRDELHGGGNDAEIFQADVSNAGQVARLFQQFEERFGQRLEMLVNSAGEWMDKLPIAECSEDHWDRMFALNAKSVFLCCRHAAQRMIPRHSGAILNVGSLAGHTGGGGGTVPYAAAKAAVHTFTRGLARELAPHGIRVNAVAPGMIDTPMLAGRLSPEGTKQLLAATPLGRFGNPAEIAPLALSLLSPASSYVTGQIVEINGGLLMR
jgi:3-oxoacyl-[acyl-carrier protein] reductase